VREIVDSASRLKDKSRRILKADLPQAADAYKLARATRKKFVLRLSSAQTRPVVRLGGRSPFAPRCSSLLMTNLTENRADLTTGVFRKGEQ